MLLRTDGDEELFSIADRGAGFAPETIPLLFDRFWRAGLSSDGSGSGLGLAIVDAIVSAHGGTVTAGNREGGGVMTVRFPIERSTR